MGNTVSHPIKLYQVKLNGDKNIIHTQKSRLLKVGIKDLLKKGRVVLSARWSCRYAILSNVYVSAWGFQVVYIGRKAVWGTGIRHLLRKAHKEFNPYITPWARLEEG